MFAGVGGAGLVFVAPTAPAPSPIHPLLTLRTRPRPRPHLSAPQVLHPLAMQPAIKAGSLNVRVKNSYNRSASGTVITSTRDLSGTVVTSIVLKPNVTMVDVHSTRMLGAHGARRGAAGAGAGPRAGGALLVVARGACRHSVHAIFGARTPCAAARQALPHLTSCSTGTSPFPKTPSRPLLPPVYPPGSPHQPPAPRLPIQGV